MSWSDLNYQSKLQIIDRILLYSNEEKDLKLANGLVSAARELELHCNSYSEENKKIIKDFIEPKSFRGTSIIWVIIWVILILFYCYGIK